MFGMLLVLGGTVWAQTGETTDVALRRGFRDITLGMPFAAVQQALGRDAGFDYRGEPDVSMRLSDAEQVIDTRGRVFVDRGIFQFAEGSLYSFSLYLDRSRLDYFQVFNQLSQRYGDPVELDPQRAFWQDRATRIELERPLTVRYLDRAVFEERRQAQRTLEAVEDVTREQFLEEF